MVRMRSRRQRLRLVGFVLPVVLLSTTACLATTADGGVMTPQQPGQTGTVSRLPQLLPQLQGSNGAGLEPLDGTQSQVLAAQEAGGKAATMVTPAGSSTVIGTVTPTAAIGARLAQDVLREIGFGRSAMNLQWAAWGFSGGFAANVPLAKYAQVTSDASMGEFIGPTLPGGRAGRRLCLRQD